MWSYLDDDNDNNYKKDADDDSHKNEANTKQGIQSKS